MSHTINDMLETLGVDIENDITSEVPINNITAKILGLVKNWVEFHQDDAQPSAEDIKDKQAETIDEWDQKYLKMPLGDLYELVRLAIQSLKHSLEQIFQISAANFLNIPGLLWITTREIAYMIKGKSPEEIRQQFGIENDWTQSELEAVQKENQWCEEK